LLPKCGGWHVVRTKLVGKVANDWSKAGDRDVNGYIDVMRQQVKGEWTVHHQLWHVEKRKKYRVEGPLDNGGVGQLGR
jgi:hypothetical protein